MEVCFFRQYLPSGKPGNSNSTQKIAAVIQMNRTKTNRATRENLCIMHSATAHSKLTVRGIISRNTYRESLYLLCDIKLSQLRAKQDERTEAISRDFDFVRKIFALNLTFLLFVSSFLNN